jgi:hypothetical protein
MELQPVISIGNEAYAEQLALVVGSAFVSDALNRAKLLTVDSMTNDAEITVERRASYFLPTIRQKALHGALLVEAANWAAVALWYTWCTGSCGRPL